MALTPCLSDLRRTDRTRRPRRGTARHHDQPLLGHEGGRPADQNRRRRPARCRRGTPTGNGDAHRGATLGRPDPDRLARPRPGRGDPALRLRPRCRSDAGTARTARAGARAAGPVAVTETWGKLRTDSVWHTVPWVSEWPRSMVYPGFLAPAVHRHPTLGFADLHADALGPGRTRHPQEEGRTHLGRRSTCPDGADRGRRAERRVPGRVPTRSRPDRRPRGTPPLGPCQCLRADARRAGSGDRGD